MSVIVGVCAGPTDRFERCAAPGFAAHAPGVDVVVLRGRTSIFEAYEEIRRAASEVPDLEFVALVHDDLELRDSRWTDEIRAALSDPAVAVVGVIGGRGPGGMAWWGREERFGRVEEVERLHDPSPDSTYPVEVDVADGVLLALSPWAVRNLSFHRGEYPAFHGYDAELCAQARAAGHKVVVIRSDVVHHTETLFRSRDSYRDWLRASLVWRRRWATPSRWGRLILAIRSRLMPVEMLVRPGLRARARGLPA